jgi:hypothetical protein
LIPESLDKLVNTEYVTELETDVRTQRS